MQTPLRDSLGRTLGFVQTEPNGTQRLFDAMGRFRGSYEPAFNRTLDAMGRLVGTGNLLSMLLK